MNIQTIYRNWDLSYEQDRQINVYPQYTLTSKMTELYARDSRGEYKLIGWRIQYD